MYSQTNIEQLFKLIGSVPNQEYRETENFDFISTANNIWPNQLLNLKANKYKVDEVLDSIELKSSTNSGPELLMCNPSSDDHQVIERIKKRNYKSSEWSAMTFNLAVGELPSLKCDISIKSVDNRNELNSWLAIVEAELMNNEKLNPEIFKFLLESKDCHFFLAYQNGEAVATSFLFKESKVAGAYLISTSKKHRNKGIGAQMTLNCLEKAKELNCLRLELQATDLGRKVYESLGFINHGIINVFRIKKY